MNRLAVVYPDCSPGEVAYLFVNEVSARPICPCGGRVSWFGNRFAKFCSYECSNRDGRTAKSQATMAQARIDNPNWENALQDKRRATMLEKYGSLVSDKHRTAAKERSANLNTKGRETLLRCHGVANPGQLPMHREKSKATLMKNYGVETWSSSPVVISARHARRLRRVEALLSAGTTVLDIFPPKNDEANFRYSIRCKCGEDYTIPSETFKYRLRTFGGTCSDCLGIQRGQSLAEKEVAALLPGSKTNILGVIPPYELDIFSEEHNLAVEYCGIYWHSEKAGKDKHYHRRKLDLCRAQGIRLITIFEDEWINNPSLVASMLNNAKGSSRRIHARQCTVGHVDTATASAFIKKNHMQGGGRSKVKLGLFHKEDGLVAIMTFSDSEASRRSVGWDINRFCVQQGVSIAGGASKLFSAFRNEFSPNRVVSYADLRWGTGNVYGKLGFVHVGDTTPGYWYFRSGEMRRYHRYGLRKKPDEPKHITEWDLRVSQGWNRIWDCGHAKWVWDDIPKHL